ncbi:MAG: hypothetical protein O3C40_32630 [Planctomycetota bacterium]|nr:hypothetical protein [Planctomycetota bacterium]
MPNNSDDTWLNEALCFAPQEVIPLLFLGDDSRIAQVVHAALASLAEPDLSRVIRLANWDNFSVQREDLYSEQFRRSIHPRRIWAGSAPWCVTVIDSATTPVTSYLKLRADLRDREMWPLQHMLFVCGSAEVSFWQDAATALADIHDPVFFLSEKGAQSRSSELIAAGVASYIFTAWSRYFETQDGNLRNALCLWGPARIFTLGVGRDVPDIDYQTAIWRPPIQRRLFGEWCEKITGDVPHHSFPATREIIERWLPEDAYYLDAPEEGTGSADAWAGPTIAAASQSAEIETVRIRYREDSRTPGFPSHTALYAWSQRIALLDKLRSLLRIVDRQSVDTVISVRSRPFSGLLRKRVDSYLVVSDEPAGMFTALRQRLINAAGYLKDLALTESREATEGQSLQNNKVLLKKRVGWIPSMPGALMRVALISVGLAWLFIGTFLWAPGSHPFNDPVMRWAAIGAASVLVLLATGVVAQYWITTVSAENCARDARRDLIHEHLYDVGNIIVDTLRKLVAPLSDHVKQLEGDLNSLAAVVCGETDWTAHEKSDGVFAKKALVNANPRFGPDSFSTLVKPLIGDLAKRVHKAIKADLESRDWPTLDQARWLEVVAIRGEEVTRDTLVRFKYEEAARSAGLTSNDLELVVSDVVSAARHPAFPSPMTPNCHVVLYAPTDWQRYLGRHDNVRIYGLNLKGLMAVAAIPLVLE